MSAKRIQTEPYILIYVLGKSKELTYIIGQVKRFYRNRRVIWIGMENNNGYPFGNVLYNVGPAEFISLVKYADAVVTDSFHGTVFSILYEKQVYSIKRIVNSNDVYDYDCRIKNIFSILDIHNYYESNDSIDFETSVIDYKKVRELLSNERQKSLNYILDSLKKEHLLDDHYNIV